LEQIGGSMQVGDLVRDITHHDNTPPTIGLITRIGYDGQRSIFKVRWLFGSNWQYPENLEVM
jgi:hypothetical protein